MEISKIWLKTESGDVVVTIEIDGEWYRLIEYRPGERDIVVSCEVTPNEPK